MTSWSFDGTVLPDGRRTRLVIGSGPVEQLPGHFALSGMVDAHCHLTVAKDSSGPYLVGREVASRRLAELAHNGVTAIRDTGGERTVTLPLTMALRRGQPEVVACGRFFSSSGRYFPRLHVPVSADELVDAVLAEIEAGATWVKLVGDFPATDQLGVVPDSSVEPAYDLEHVSAVVATAHAHGARVAAHTTSTLVSGLIGAGIDSVEHGNALTIADLESLGGRGGAWTPTIGACVLPGPGDPTPDQRRRQQQASERFAALLPHAAAYGVRVLTGSDVVGSVAAEVALMVAHGMTVDAALAAATTDAQDYLRLGASDDLVTYLADPREDPAVLSTPAAVLVRGHRVR